MLKDAKFLATGLFLQLGEDELDAIVQRAGEIAIKMDGIGIEGLPEKSKESLLRAAYRSIEEDKAFAKRPPLFTDEEIAEREAKHAAAEAAAGNKPTLAARGRYIQTYGIEAYRKMMSDWGADPATLKAGKEPRARRRSPELERKTDDKKKSDDQPSLSEITANPWLDDSDRGEQRRIAVIKLPPKNAVLLAKAAFRDLAGRPLKRAS